MRLFLILMVLHAMTYLNAFPQSNNWCGMEQAYQKAISEYPELARKLITEQIAFQQHYLNYYLKQAKSSQLRSAPPVYIIPVVFHIIHDYGPENISDEQIADQMRILNEDFNQQNPDVSDVIPEFQGIVGNAEIEFRLATLDPEDNCTKGIDRNPSFETYIGDESSKLNPWPRGSYLNIWVVNSINQAGIAGYTFLPSDNWPPVAQDGIIVEHRYVGSIGTGNESRSRTLTHEIGHWLNLLHPWGNGNEAGLESNCDIDDGVEDTPNTIGWSECILDGSSCGSLDNVQNYMGFAFCNRMFTQGQAARMRAALTATIAQRNTLWSTENLSATGTLEPAIHNCPPVADFTTDRPDICRGETITFFDHSWQSAPESWSWTFDGGEPASSTEQEPVITFNTPGRYSVTLTVQNQLGESTKTKTGFVLVEGSATFFSPNEEESFENLDDFNDRWTVTNHDNQHSWQFATETAFSGSSSLKMNNFSNSDGQVDELISPSYDFSEDTLEEVIFKLAFARQNEGNNDRLKAYISTDCGENWRLRFSKLGAALATVPPRSVAYMPKATSEWKEFSFNIPPSDRSSPNIRFKYEFTNDGGNNFYMDDIFPLGLTLDEKHDGNIVLFPNPTKDRPTIQLDLFEKQKIWIGVFNVYGQKLHEIPDLEFQAGTQLFVLDFQFDTQGIYYIHLIGKNIKATAKLLVPH